MRGHMIKKIVTIIAALILLAVAWFIYIEFVEEKPVRKEYMARARKTANAQAKTKLKKECPYCHKKYGKAMPGDEERILHLQEYHERNCPERKVY